GDGGDVWPGSTGAREFHDLTVPNTHTNLLGPFNNDATTRIGIWNISNSGSVMTADLDEDWSRPWPLLTATENDSIIFDDSAPGGDGDGVLEPRETIKVYVTMKNVMRTSFNATVSLTGDNPAVTFVTNQVLLASVFDETEQSNLTTAIEFTLAPSFIPTIDSFQLVIQCDSTPTVPYDSAFSRSFGIEVTLGPPQVLIVDDDRGEDYENVYIEAMYAEHIPHDVWHKLDEGSPSGDDLKRYPMVFWHTGDSAENIFTAADVAAMKAYLDAAGNLLLSSISGAKALNDLDVTFLNDYLGANWVGSLSWPWFEGVAGNQLGDGTKYRYQATVPVNSALDLVDTVGSGDAAFKLGGRSEICGVTKQGAYNTVFVTFPIEYLADQFAAFDTTQELFSRVLDVFGGIPLDADDGRPHAALPMNFDLHQNYPNPFNPSTTISYTLRPTSGRLPRTTLSIFNLLGQRVVTLVDKIQLPGTYNIQWDGATEAGRSVASGVYFYKLNRGQDSQSRKMMLLK
ncbi:MAG: T9SS type A sorting domain-containing protein, partial [candidate division Zixibacteria bacterium]|nr:T9SS type A sorting domain-containing protein [candidate division Zixibacteria bacterium]